MSERKVVLYMAAQLNQGDSLHGSQSHNSHHHSQHHSHHHHTEEKEKKRGLSFYLWIAALCMFALSLLVMVFYTAHKFIPFVRSVLYYHKLNTSTLSYIALRLLMVALPAALLFPSKFYYRKENRFDKPKLLSIILNLTALFYFIGMVADIVTYNVLGGYVDDGTDPIMLKLLWNNTGLRAVGFCMVQGIMYLIISKKIRTHKKTVFWLLFTTFALSAVMPIAENYFSNNMFSPAWYTWFYKNIYFYVSELLMLVGFGISMSKRSVWSRAIWH